jgi:hypothetical protein
MVATTSNLVMGPATLYIGAFGATEPADSAVNAAPAASAWTDVGATQGGVDITIKQDYKDLDVDQIVDVPGARLTSRKVIVATSLAEPTVNNLLYALNDGTAGSGTGYNKYDPAFASSATQPTFRALIIDGWAPGGVYTRRLIVRKALSTVDVKMSYQKDKETVFSVSWDAYYVSSSIAPFHVVDQTSA